MAARCLGIHPHPALGACHPRPAGTARVPASRRVQRRSLGMPARTLFAAPC